MPYLGQRSLARLSTCHPELQRLMYRAIEIVPLSADFTVLCGYRGEEEQTDAYERGTSKRKFPYSMHNKSPSLAVDVAPYPIDWDDLGRFRELAGYVFDAAIELQIPVRWGGHWKKPLDMPHFELRGVRG